MSSWWSTLNPFTEVHAEEAQDEKEEIEESSEGGDEEEETEDGDDEEEEDEEEEEEDEPEDPKPALVEQKHHFDECAARVAHAAENPDENHHGHAEDCAEEFLHLMHCVDNKIAEPLFRQLR